jgi:hypothetical protein
LALLLFAAPIAHAACTDPVAREGAIVYNADQNVPQVCAGDTWVALGGLNPSAGSGSCSDPSAIEGAIVYNDDFDVLQYCDGTNWIAVQAASVGGCTAPASCPNVGDICNGDGSGGGNPKFAGCICYYDANSADAGSCKALYVTQSNQSTSSQWKNATGTDDISTDSTEDGKINHANRGGALSDFPAFELCENLTDGGYTDWYLPARTEFNLLWRNNAAAGGFTTSDYWSSTESSLNNAWYQTISSGSLGSAGKNLNRDVRCVRRD